jgi:hypothetical protein
MSDMVMPSSPAPEPETIKKPWGYVVMVNGEQVARVIKDRKLFALDDDWSLEPNTLVGSVFHVILDGEFLWQGVVVAEPQSGRYLCHLDHLSPIVKDVQRMFALDTLMGYGDEGKRLIEGAMSESRAPVVDPSLEWRFYDSISSANEAYGAAQIAKVQRERMES